MFISISYGSDIAKSRHYIATMLLHDSVFGKSPIQVKRYYERIPGAIFEEEEFFKSIFLYYYNRQYNVGKNLALLTKFLSIKEFKSFYLDGGCSEKQIIDLVKFLQKKYCSDLVSYWNEIEKERDSYLDKLILLG